MLPSDQERAMSTKTKTPKDLKDPQKPRTASRVLTLTVEAAVPIPASTRGSTAYPFASMGIGDSFAAPYTTYEECTGLRGRFTSVVGTYVKRQATLGKVVAFTVRNVADKKEVRVWRVQPKEKPTPATE
jgi:hypothetical protein